MRIEDHLGANAYAKSNVTTPETPRLPKTGERHPYFVFRSFPQLVLRFGEHQCDQVHSTQKTRELSWYIVLIPMDEVWDCLERARNVQSRSGE